MPIKYTRVGSEVEDMAEYDRALSAAIAKRNDAEIPAAIGYDAEIAEVRRSEADREHTLLVRSADRQAVCFVVGMLAGAGLVAAGLLL